MGIVLVVSICLIGSAKSECSWSNRPIETIAEGKAACIRLLQAAELSGNFYVSCEIQEVEHDPEPEPEQVMAAVPDPDPDLYRF